jgi:protein-disulfide isomerase
MRTAMVCTIFFASGLVCALGHAAARPQPLPLDACPGGDRASAVVMEVFSDFQCPGCANLYQENLRNVLTDYVATRRVCVLFQEFPLPQHKYARMAASYAVAALRVSPAIQVKVIDTLYSTQARWSEDGQVEQVLTETLTNEEMRRVSLWLEHPEVEAEIRRDLESGKELGVRSTPTVFVHYRGTIRRIPSTVQWEVLRRYLDYLVSKPPVREKR